MSTILKRIKYIYRNEGLVSLVKRMFKFMMSIPYEYRKFYVLGRKLQNLNEADYLPRIKDFDFRIIETGKQLDELISDSYDVSFLNLEQE